MAELYRFMTGVASDRLYTAADFNDVAYQMWFRGEGVIKADNNLAVTNAGTLSVDINTGVATKVGALYKNTASLNKALSAVTSGAKRYDRVVIRISDVTRDFVATIIEGVEGASPTAPAIVSATDVLLAKILIDRSSGSYVYTVTDERVYRAYDPIIAATAAKMNAGTYTLDDIAEGTTYKRVAAATAAKMNAGTYTLDDIAEGTTYKRVAAAKATAINSAGAATATPTAGAVVVADGSGKLDGWIASYDPAGSATTAINNHKDLTTGVHGVGAGTIAKTSDIPVKAAYTDINTGSDDAKFATAAALKASLLGKRVAEIDVFEMGTSVASGDDKRRFCVPLELNGYNLVQAEAYVSTYSSSGAFVNVQIYSIALSHDMLAAAHPITIDNREYTSYTAADRSVVDTSYDNVATGDILRIDVDATGTGTNGLAVILTFALP